MSDSVDANSIVSRQAQKIGELQTDVFVRDAYIEQLQAKIAQYEGENSEEDDEK